MKGVFVTGTGTGAGKTRIAASLARALTARGEDVVAIKPIETGVVDRPADAVALAEACGKPALATDAAWFRSAAPVSPRAAILEGEGAIDVERIVAQARALTRGRCAIVEGAGGLLVPLDEKRTIADLAMAIGLPLLVVAPDRLGVLSDVLAVHEAADRRGLAVAAIALSRVGSELDASTRTNARILRERLAAPVRVVEHGASEMDDLLGDLRAAGIIIDI